MQPTHLPARTFDRHAPAWKLLSETPSTSYLLYRFYDADRQALYIGITQSGQTRLAEHRRRSEWWPLAEYFAFSAYPDWPSLELAESAAIRTEAPRFNKAGTQWRQQAIVRLDGHPQDVAQELHRIGRPEFISELARLLARPEDFPQFLPPPPARFSA